MLTDGQRRLYAQGGTTLPQDGRVGASHDRFYRGFVPVPHGPHVIRFYPLKRWVQVVGVTNVTLRKWLAQNVIAAYKMYRMPVMCLAEQIALRDVVRKYHVGNMRYDQISPEFVSEARYALVAVRTALDNLKRKVPLTPEQTALLEPSLKEFT